LLLQYWLSGEEVETLYAERRSLSAEWRWPCASWVALSSDLETAVKKRVEAAT